MFWNQELSGLQLCSLFKIDLAIQGPLRFHVNFGMVLFVWKCLWGFDRDYTESSDCFGECGHFNNKPSNLPTQDGFPFICLLWFLLAMLCSSQCTNLSTPWLSIFPNVLFFLMPLSVRLRSLTFLFYSSFCCYYCFFLFLPPFYALHSASHITFHHQEIFVEWKKDWLNESVSNLKEMLRGLRMLSFQQ